MDNSVSIRSLKRTRRFPYVYYTLSIFAIIYAVTWLDLHSLYNNNNHSRTLTHKITNHNFFVPSEHEKIIPFSNRKPSDNITYATFGSSVTWGALAEPIPRSEFAYPWLLSPSVANHAIRASGPNYPANCLYSMIGNDRYDVIVLEYFMMATSGLRTLATRMRERFPDAVIVIMVNWYAAGMIVTKDGKQLLDWAVERGYSPGTLFHDKKMHEEMRKSEEEGWKWEHINAVHKIKYIEGVAEDTNSYISFMERPDDPRDWFNYAHFLDHDGHHLSRAGHLNVAHRVRQIVDRVGVPSHSRIGNLSYTDSCVNWFETAVTTGVTFSENMKLEKMPNTLKFALSIQDDRDGYVSVHNPSNQSQALYLTYMTTGPSPSKYPKTEVVIVDKEGSSLDQKFLSEPIILDPNPNNNFGEKSVHVIRMEPVADIKPGESMVRIRPLEKTEWPFRLVSVIVTHRSGGFNGLHGPHRNKSV